MGRLDIIQAGSRKQKGEEVLLGGVVLIQASLMRLTAGHSGKGEIEVGRRHRLMAKGWGCPGWAVIPVLDSLTISLFLDLGVDLTHCSLEGHSQLRKTPSTLCAQLHRASKCLAAR